MGWFGDGHWLSATDGDARARALYERHYSCHQYKDGRKRTIFVGPGEKMLLMTMNCDALFIWRKFKDDSGQQGVNCSVFRNESPIRSSDLIREAVEFAWRRWRKSIGGLSLTGNTICDSRTGGQHWRWLSETLWRNDGFAKLYNEYGFQEIAAPFTSDTSERGSES